MMLPRPLCQALLGLALALPLSAQAWWNEAWPQRTRYQLDTTAQGQPLAEAVTGVPLAIRLHSGNFDFAGAKDDGSDLRVLAADDKTVLPHRIERFDAVNELAVLWVVLPSVAPGSDKNAVFVYSGNAKAVAEAGAPATDAALKLAVGFDDALWRTRASTAQALALRGLAHAQGADWREARIDLEAARALVPDQPDALTGLGALGDRGR